MTFAATKYSKENWHHPVVLATPNCDRALSHM